MTSGRYLWRHMVSSSSKKSSWWCVLTDCNLHVGDWSISFAFDSVIFGAICIIVGFGFSIPIMTMMMTKMMILIYVYEWYHKITATDLSVSLIKWFTKSRWIIVILTYTPRYHTYTKANVKPYLVCSLIVLAFCYGFELLLVFIWSCKFQFFLGLILFLVPAILVYFGFSPCKIKHLDSVLVISDSSTFGPSFNHVSRICINYVPVILDFSTFDPCNFRFLHFWSL